MTAADEPRPPGLEPEYVYMEPISGGTGGYSDVYLYRQTAPIRDVAVKVLRGSAAMAGLQAIQDEATATAVLGNHPHIVQVIAARQSREGQPCIIMQYCAGGNLMQKVAEGPLDVRQVVEIGSRIASAVQAAHAKRIMHRDIKPANILIDEYGAPRLTDFGIAGRLGAEVDTSFGVSLPWCPPEILGNATGDVASDIYSLGATLWHLLAGRPPFFDPTGAPSRDVLEQRTLQSPVPATGRADVPPELDRLLARMMAKRPAERPASAAQVVAELSAIAYRLNPMPTSSRPAASAPTSSRSAASAPPPSSAAQQVVMAAAGESALAKTGIRPVQDIQEPPTPDEAEPVRRGKALVATVMSIAVLVLAAAGFVLLRLGSDRPADTRSSLDSQLSTPNGGDELPPGPVTVTATRAGAQTLHFTWIYSARLDSDTFQWMTSTGDRHGTAEKPELDLADPAGTQLCIQIKVVRASGQFATVDWSQPGCGS